MSKINRTKRAGDMSQAVEHLPSKSEVLSSNPSITHTYTQLSSDSKDERNSEIPESQP
jgi:hypothetical protein